MKKLLLILFTITVAGCVSNPKIAVDIESYFIIEVNEQNEYLTSTKKLQASELAKLLPSLIEKSKKTKVLLGYTSNPEVGNVIEIVKAIKGLSVDLFFLNSESEITQVNVTY